MTEKRFTTDNGSHEDVCLVDNLTKKEYESNFGDMVSLMNDIWNQTQRFEKHNHELEQENKQLKEQLQNIQDSFEFKWTQNFEEFDKDKLYLKDNNTMIRLDGRNLFIEVYLPSINEYYKFKYVVTGRSLMREFIGYHNQKGDVE